MAVHPVDIQVGQAGRPGIDCRRLGDIDAELVFLQAGRDIRMSARIHVRIHSQGNGRFHSQFASHLVQAIKLGVGFDIETANAGLQGPLHFPLLLANAGEYDFTGIPAGTKHTFKLSGRDYVKTGPQTSQHIEHGQIAVRLDRITHQMRAILQGLIVSTVMALQRRPGIDVGWRTKALGDIGNGNVFGVEFAVTVIEVIHAVPESLRSGGLAQGCSLSSSAFSPASAATSVSPVCDGTASGTGAFRYSGPFWPQPDTIKTTNTESATARRRTSPSCIPNPLSE